MKDLATVFIVVLLTFICSLAIFTGNARLPAAVIMIPPVILIQPLLAGVNTALHLIYAARGRIRLAALPVMWASCIVPLYIYCYCINMFGGLLGLGFTFIVYGLFTVLPVFVISSLTSAVSYYRRVDRMSNPGSPSDNDGT